MTLVSIVFCKHHFCEELPRSRTYRFIPTFKRKGLGELEGHEYPCNKECKMSWVTLCNSDPKYWQHTRFPRFKITLCFHCNIMLQQQLRFFRHTKTTAILFALYPRVYSGCLMSLFLVTGYRNLLNYPYFPYSFSQYSCSTIYKWHLCANA